MSAKGRIVLMGSGELTATMVEVHKEMLAALGPAARALFLDTPAGFQLNCDQIAGRAADYFRTKVGRPMAIASFKSAEGSSAIAAEKTYRELRQADYVLVGPGSPTYALRQWLGSSIPEILARRIEDGACFVAASAAALTVGRFTLPVYEIYKVGETPRWVPGMDLLGRFGIDLAVVPHWNNAEGGTHDTRFCFMGAARFEALAARLPPETGVLGLDEHTALVIDFARGEASVRGIGEVTLRRGGHELRLRRGDAAPLDRLRALCAHPPSRREEPRGAEAAPPPAADPFWSGIHALAEDFHSAQERSDFERMAAALLELDQRIWQAAEASGSEEILQAREILREWMALFGARPGADPRGAAACLGPLVEAILEEREALRAARRWEEADRLRRCLERAGIQVEDTVQGARWRLEGGR